MNRARTDGFDMYTHRISYGRVLRRLSRWPLQHIFDEILRLRMDNERILSMPLPQPLISTLTTRHYTLRGPKGEGKGKVCVPIPDHLVCPCEDDTMKCNCDYPDCPIDVHRPWSLSSVIDNKVLRLKHNECRIRYLMRYARRRSVPRLPARLSQQENIPPAYRPHPESDSESIGARSYSSQG